MWLCRNRSCRAPNPEDGVRSDITETRKMHPTPLSFSQRREEGGLHASAWNSGCGCGVCTDVFGGIFWLIANGIGFVPDACKTRFLTLLHNVLIYFRLYLIILLLFPCNQKMFLFNVISFCLFSSLHCCQPQRSSPVYWTAQAFAYPSSAGSTMFLHEWTWLSCLKAEWWNRLNLYYTGKEAALWYSGMQGCVQFWKRLSERKTEFHSSLKWSWKHSVASYATPK